MLEDGEPVNPDVSPVVTDEVLRQRIRVLIDEKPKPSTFQTISSNPLVLVLASFLLSVPIGAFLTYYYGKQQLELAARRSFSDELNKIRIQKLGEVWEHIDENELTIDHLLDDSLSARANPKDSSANDERGDKIRNLIEEDFAIISKNRFWLGELNYKRIRTYLDLNIKYALSKLLDPRGTDLSEVFQKREEAKQDILKTRSMFLAGEL